MQVVSRLNELFFEDELAKRRPGGLAFVVGTTRGGTQCLDNWACGGCVSTGWVGSVISGLIVFCGEVVLFGFAGRVVIGKSVGGISNGCGRAFERGDSGRQKMCEGGRSVGSACAPSR